jgi:beta-glucanase (GH16 family)
MIASTEFGDYYSSSCSKTASSPSSSTKLKSGIFNDEYHVFSILWYSQKIIWLLDGVQYHVIDITPGGLEEFHKPFFFIFNVAVGGKWPGSPDGSTLFPQEMKVDYIRVFQKK